MLNIHYQDEHIVVVHKPSGLLVHRSNIDKYETEFLLQTLRDQIGHLVYPVHRLDKPTSGLMVFGLSKQAAQVLTEAFTQKEVAKSYLAVVRGFVVDQIIDYPLKEQLDKMTDQLACQQKAPQDAVTAVKVLATTTVNKPVGRYEQARFSLVSLTPHTGRKHQLRRHMAHIRHPIIGDTTHGDGKQNQFGRVHLSLHRLALLASTLQFSHPVSGQNMQFEAELDQDLEGIWQIFNGTDNKFTIEN